MFKLHSKFTPTGDQPQAIEKLVEGFKNGYDAQTLLGVTGSGKTFTMANVIQKLNKPTIKSIKMIPHLLSFFQYIFVHFYFLYKFRFIMYAFKNYFCF